MRLSPQARCTLPMGSCEEGTDGSWTLRWREMDSNFQYAGAVNLFVAPFVVPGCLKSPPATRSRRKRQGPFQGLRVPRHPAQEDVVGGSAGTAPHDLPVASVRCLYCFCPSHFASVGEHRSYAVKRSGGYIRNHRPSERRRLSRLRQRPGRSAGCRSDPSNRARQKARQPDAPRSRTRSSNPFPSRGESANHRSRSRRSRGYQIRFGGRASAIEEGKPRRASERGFSNGGTDGSNPACSDSESAPEACGL